MNAFDKLEFWASLAAVVLLIGGLAAMFVAGNFVLGAIMVVVGLVCGWLGRVATTARERAAQNALIRRK